MGMSLETNANSGFLLKRSGVLSGLLCWTGVSKLFRSEVSNEAKSSSPLKRMELDRLTDAQLQRQRQAKMPLPGGRLERLPELLGGLHRPDHIEVRKRDRSRHRKLIQNL
eukprot:symbB.v1.2.006595.t1/scaffold393.1/size213714/8